MISEISATTKGINLNYDENGNIQSYTMDRNGIQLRGDKVDITVNKDFKWQVEWMIKLVRTKLSTV